MFVRAGAAVGDGSTAGFVAARVSAARVSAARVSAGRGALPAVLSAVGEFDAIGAAVGAGCAGVAQAASKQSVNAAKMDRKISYMVCLILN